MPKTILLGLILSTCLASPAFAASWFEIGTSDIEIAFADGDSIQRSGDVVQIQAFHGFDPGQGENGDIYYVQRQLEFDCPAHRMRQIKLTAFDADRNVLDAPAYSTEWMAVVPDTPEETFSKVACEGGLTGTPYPDAFDAADEYWGDGNGVDDTQSDTPV